MLPWEVDAIINIALLGFGLWVRRRPQPRRALGRLVVAYGALFVVSSFVGIAVGVLLALDPFAGETFDSSHGTLTAMELSCAATGVVAFLLPTIAALAMFRRSHDDTSQGGPRPAVQVDAAPKSS
jgi:hypothetical protein